MAKQNGGARPGAGRPKGVPNRSRAEFVRALQQPGRVDRLVGKLLELSEGVTVMEKTAGVPKIYSKPPDVYAITYMLDQAFGKARQHVEVEGGGASYEQLILGLGQALIGSARKASAGEVEG